MKKTNELGYTLEFREGTAWNEKNKAWYMECKVCGKPSKVGGEHILSTTCYKCVSQGLKEFEEDARS